MNRDFSGFLQRLQGHAISVVTFDRSRLLGTLASVADDCIRMTGVIVQDSLESGGWSDRFLVDDLLEDRGNQWPEVVVQRNHISIVTLLDEAAVLEVEDNIPDSSLLSADSVVILEQPRLPDTTELLTGTDRSTGTEHASLDATSVVVELGIGLVGAFSKTGGRQKTLNERADILRKVLEERFGFHLEVFKSKCCMLLSPDQFRISVHGAVVKQGTVHPEKLLALLPVSPDVEFRGIPVWEPAFGLRSRWIDEQDRQDAELAGCTVVDACSVIATCLEVCLSKNIADLLTHESVSAAVERLRETHPTTVSSLIPQPVSLRVLFEVLRRLVMEGVVIRHLLPIVTAVARHAEHARSMETLVNRIRRDMPRILCSPFVNSAGNVPFVRVEDKAVRLLIPANSTQQSPDSMSPECAAPDSITPDCVMPDAAARMVQLTTEVRRMWRAGGGSESIGPVIVVDDLYRNQFWRLCRTHLDGVSVLSNGETSDIAEIEHLGTITAEFLKSGFPDNTVESAASGDSLSRKPR